MRVTCKILVALAGALLSGCDQTAPPRSFVPDSDPARAALEAVLDQWQAGEPPSYQAQRTPAVGVVDTRRKPGQQLERFEVLGEVPGKGARALAVRLHLINPEAVEQVRFVVIGINPLWVFRQEDFDQLAHWDHDMSAPEPKSESSETAASETASSETAPVDSEPAPAADPLTEDLP